jgi:MerR family transcriptional regulator, light-induced transcriptional regulator
MGTAVPATLAELRERYAEHLLAGDAAEAQRVLAEALRLLPIATVYHGVVAEALYEIGRHWERGEITTADEHLATGVCEIGLPDLARRLPRDGRRGRTSIVACVPNEQHAVGCRIVADFLEAAGWDILHLGADTPAGALAEFTVGRSADMVALSATMSERIADVEQTCERLRALPFPPFIAVGGQAFAGAREARGLGADVLVRSPEALVSELAERFPVGG